MRLNRQYSIEKERKGMFKKFFAVLISIIMIFTAVPNMVMAEDAAEETLAASELNDENEGQEDEGKENDGEVPPEGAGEDGESNDDEGETPGETPAEGGEDEPQQYEMKFNCSEEGFTASVYDSSWNYYYDNNGIYSLPDGSYSYDITKDGFCDESGSFTVNGENVTVDVTLTAGTDVVFNMTFGEGITDEFSSYSAAMYITGPGWVNLKSTDTANKMKYCLPDGTYIYSAYYYYDWNDYNNYYYNYGEFTVSGSTVEKDVVFGFKTEFVSEPSGATITVFDKDGNEIKGYYGRYGLENGEYTYKAENNLYKTVEDTFTVENAAQVITIPMERSTSDDNIIIKQASFALKGDDGIWIKKTSVKIEDGMTAFDLVTKVLAENGYTPVLKGTYISAITTPDGKTLGEGDLGGYSGWMYSANDVIPSFGLNEMKLQNGDFIYMFFTLDYTLEKYPEDFSGGGGGGGGSSAQTKPAEEEKTEEEKPAEGETVKEKTAIEYLMGKGIFAGMSEDDFGADIFMTRAMFSTVMFRLDGMKKVYSETKYDDVKENSWYSDAVDWAGQSGVMTGYGNGKFGPDDVITKGQAASVLYRYLIYKGTFTEDEKKAYEELDNIPEDTADFAKTPLKWAVKEEIMTSDNSASGITRGYCADILRPFAKKYVFND